MNSSSQHVTDRVVYSIIRGFPSSPSRITTIFLEALPILRQSGDNEIIAAPKYYEQVGKLSLLTTNLWMVIMELIATV